MFKLLKNILGKRNNTTPTQNTVHALAKENADIISGFELHVTMLPRVPLKTLKRHGEKARRIPKKDANLHPGEATWLPALGGKLAVLTEGEATWSTVGQIPQDGGDVLPYLIALREIVERPMPSSANEIDEALKRLEAIKALPGGAVYTVTKNGNLKKSRSAKDYFLFFFKFDADAMKLILQEMGAPDYNGLGYSHIIELHNSGYNSIQEMLTAPDDVLLSLKGIGKAKLAKIRNNISN